MKTDEIMALADAYLYAAQDILDLSGSTMNARIVLRTAIEALVRDATPSDWSVFNTGAEVASGLSYAEAMDYLTPGRVERGWSAVCVVDKTNIAAIAAQEVK